VKRWQWIDGQAFILLHTETLAEHGGLAGLRDEAALEAALARPQHLHRYQPNADAARLAAAYGFGIVRGHPFSDGNKRAGFLAIGLFLALNDFELAADPLETIATVMTLAAGRLTEAELARWIRKPLVRAR
jgi:death-on-curing protein